MKFAVHTRSPLLQRFAGFIGVMLILLAIALPARCTESSPVELRPAILSDQLSHLTLTDILRIARQNYPSIRAARFRQESAKEGIKKEKTLYLPRGSLLVQETRATSNNITGPLIPNLVIPQIGGAVAGGNDMTGGWGSAAGTLITWEPFDFGFRRATVDAARTQDKLAQVSVALTELEVLGTAADAYLRASQAQQALRAARAKLDRMRIFRESVSVLAGKHLRSTTDSFLAEAEEAKARDQVTEAEQAVDFALIALSEATGLSSSKLTIEDGSLIRNCPRDVPIVGSLDAHPLFAKQVATVKFAEARLRVVGKSYYPKFTLAGALYGRGSSFKTDVSINEAKGYYPTIFNYAVGLNIYFPYFDIFEQRAKKRIELKNVLAEQSLVELTSLRLRCEDERAQALMKSAVKILDNAPIKVRAANEAVKSVKVRYDLGLSSVNDVALDEQLLTESEVEESTAKLRVWRALLAEAVAKGDINQFLRAVDEASRK